ncbi:DUF6415 family natural product biosynthesis protein [Streptomyces sp. NPDC006670]|uniref:DUF6415 family natural product biosynthesis protein n=1 Tax=Streptomyces sp. NPDC006670 TaxID=3154476 RepID=UPI0033C8DE9F
MRVLTTTTASHEPRYGAPSSALLAHGYAQFLAQQAEHPDDSDGQDPPGSTAHLRDNAPARPPMDTHLVLHDPEGLLEGELPLDRGPHECLAKAVLGWTGNPGLAPADLQQIALQLTGAARAVADDVHRAADQLPPDHAPRVLADTVLKDAERHLTAGLQGTVRCAQGRARLVRALYESLDCLTETAPRPTRAL